MASMQGTYTPKPGESDKIVKLKTVLYREEQNCRSWQDGELTQHRKDSLDYYNREPIGDEEPGQSQVVTSEYQDTIESIMPSLIRVFTGGDQVVEFSADNPQDQQWEDQATDYVTQILMRENEGFVFWTWFLKDALMYRLSWAAVDVEEKKETKSKDFNGIPEDAFALLTQQATQMAEQAGAELDIDATPDGEDDKADKKAVQYGEGMPQSHCGICQHYQGGSCELVKGDIEPDDWCKLFALRTPASPPPKPRTYSGTITTTRTVHKIVVDNVAPEDGLVSPMARHIDLASMAGYRKKVTASDLILMGMTEEEIRELATDELYTVEQAQRQPDVIQATSERDSDDDSERTYWIVVAFVRFDWDEDGDSELLRVVYAHAGGEPSAIIELEEWKDGIAPVVPASPILMSHTIPGKSVFDLVKDLQDIGTAVWRAALNNTYLVTRPRPAVSDAVDLASLIDWTPGMPVRMRQGKKPTPDELNWLQVPPIMDKALMILEKKDELLQKRTGVTSNQQGVLDENMNPTAAGAAYAVSAASDRIELIARTIAETAGKRLYRLIYKAIKRVASGPVTYRSGDDFKTVDPTQWPDDMSLDVNVGFGAANKQQQLQHLMLVAQGQEKLIQAQGGPSGPVVKLPHLANTFRRMLRTIGIKGTDQYVANDPEIEKGVQDQQQQGPPPNPEMIKAQGHVQAMQQKNQMDAQLDQQKHAADLQAQQAKAQMDLTVARERTAGELQIMREKMMGEQELARQKMVMDDALNRQELAEEMRLKELKIRMDGKKDGPDATNIKEQQIGDGN